MRFAFIAAEQAHHSLSLLCRCLRVTRSGFYAWRDRPASARRQQDARLKVLIRAAFDASHQRYGSPRLHRDLRDDHEERVSRKRVIRLMQEEGLQGRAPRRFVCTTDSDHDRPVAANLLNREFSAEAPNRRWVGDTTELVTSNGKLFLAVILDLFSKFVVGWSLSPVNDRHLTIAALKRAVLQRCPGADLLHHSDQGSTYASEDYQKILADHGVVCSMSRRGNPYDNAVMEAWNSTFKFECGERFD